MKKMFSFLLIAFVMSCGKKSGNNLTVDGSIKNGTAKVVYLEQNHPDGTPPVIIDSANVEKGTFRIKSMVQEESLLSLRADKSMYPFAQFINDRNNITIEADISQPGQVKVSGSPSSESLIAFNKKMNEDGRAMSDAVNDYQQLSQKKTND